MPDDPYKVLYPFVICINNGNSTMIVKNSSFSSNFLEDKYIPISFSKHSTYSSEKYNIIFLRKDIIRTDGVSGDSSGGSGDKFINNIKVVDQTSERFKINIKTSIPNDTMLREYTQKSYTVANILFFNSTTFISSYNKTADIKTHNNGISIVCTSLIGSHIKDYEFKNIVQTYELRAKQITDIIESVKSANGYIPDFIIGNLGNLPSKASDTTTINKITTLAHIAIRELEITQQNNQNRGLNFTQENIFRIAPDILPTDPIDIISILQYKISLNNIIGTTQPQITKANISANIKMLDDGFGKINNNNYKISTNIITDETLRITVPPPLTNEPFIEKFKITTEIKYFERLLTLLTSNIVYNDNIIKVNNSLNRILDMSTADTRLITNTLIDLQTQYAKTIKNPDIKDNYKNFNPYIPLFNSYNITFIENRTFKKTYSLDQSNLKLNTDLFDRLQLTTIIQMLDNIMSICTQGYISYIKRDLGCFSLENNTIFSNKVLPQLHTKSSITSDKSSLFSKSINNISYSNLEDISKLEINKIPIDKLKSFYTMNYPSVIETYLYQQSNTFNTGINTGDNTPKFYSESQITYTNDNSKKAINFTRNGLLVDTDKKNDDILLRLLLIPTAHLKLLINVDVRNTFEYNINPAKYSAITKKALENFYGTSVLEILENRLSEIINNNFNDNTDIITYLLTKDDSGNLINLTDSKKLIILYEIIYIVLRIKFINYHINIYNIDLTKKEKPQIMLIKEVEKSKTYANVNKTLLIYNKLSKAINTNNSNIQAYSDYEPLIPSILFKYKIKRFEETLPPTTPKSYKYLIEPTYINNDNNISTDIKDLGTQSIIYKTSDELLKSSVSNDIPLEYLLKYVSYILYIYMQYILFLLYNDTKNNASIVETYNRLSRDAVNSFKSLEEDANKLYTNTSTPTTNPISTTLTPISIDSNVAKNAETYKNINQIIDAIKHCTDIIIINIDNINKGNMCVYQGLSILSDYETKAKKNQYIDQITTLKANTTIKETDILSTYINTTFNSITKRITTKLEHQISIELLLPCRQYALINTTLYSSVLIRATYLIFNNIYDLLNTHTIININYVKILQLCDVIALNYIEYSNDNNIIKDDNINHYKLLYDISTLVYIICFILNQKATSYVNMHNISGGQIIEISTLYNMIINNYDGIKTTIFINNINSYYIMKPLNIVANLMFYCSTIFRQLPPPPPLPGLNNYIDILSYCREEKNLKLVYYCNTDNYDDINEFHIHNSRILKSIVDKDDDSKILYNHSIYTEQYMELLNSNSYNMNLLAYKKSTEIIDKCHNKYKNTVYNEIFKPLEDNDKNICDHINKLEIYNVDINTKQYKPSQITALNSNDYNFYTDVVIIFLDLLDYYNSNRPPGFPSFSNDIIADLYTYTGYVDALNHVLNPTNVIEEYLTHNNFINQIKNMPTTINVWFYYNNENDQIKSDVFNHINNIDLYYNNRLNTSKVETLEKMFTIFYIYAKQLDEIIYLLDASAFTLPADDKYIAFSLLLLGLMCYDGDDPNLHDVFTTLGKKLTTATTLTTEFIINNFVPIYFNNFIHYYDNTLHKKSIEIHNKTIKEYGKSLSIFNVYKQALNIINEHYVEITDTIINNPPLPENNINYIDTIDNLLININNNKVKNENLLEKLLKLNYYSRKLEILIGKNNINIGILDQIMISISYTIDINSAVVICNYLLNINIVVLLDETLATLDELLVLPTDTLYPNVNTLITNIRNTLDLYKNNVTNIINAYRDGTGSGSRSIPYNSVPPDDTLQDNITNLLNITTNLINIKHIVLHNFIENILLKNTTPTLTLINVELKTYIYSCIEFYISYYIIENDDINSYVINVIIIKSICTNIFEYIKTIITIFQTELDTIIKPYFILNTSTDNKKILDNIKLELESLHNANQEHFDYVSPLSPLTSLTSLTLPLSLPLQQPPSKTQSLFDYIYYILIATDRNNNYYLHSNVITQNIINNRFLIVDDGYGYGNKITNVSSNYTLFYNQIVQSKLIRQQQGMIAKYSHINNISMASASLGYINTFLLHYNITNTLELNISSKLCKQDTISEIIDKDTKIIHDTYFVKSSDICSIVIIANPSSYNISDFKPITIPSPPGTSQLYLLFDKSKLTYRELLSQFAKNIYDDNNTPYKSIIKNLEKYKQTIKHKHNYKQTLQHTPTLNKLIKFITDYLNNIVKIKNDITRYVIINPTTPLSITTSITPPLLDINDIKFGNLLNSFLNMIANLKNIKVFILSYINELLKNKVLNEYQLNKFTIFSNIFQLTTTKLDTIAFQGAAINKINSTTIAVPAVVIKTFNELITFASAPATDTILTLLDYFNVISFQTELINALYTYLISLAIPPLTPPLLTFNHATIINILNENMICDGDKFSILYNKYYDEFFKTNKQTSGQEGGVLIIDQIGGAGIGGRGRGRGGRGGRGRGRGRGGIGIGGPGVIKTTTPHAPKWCQNGSNNGSSCTFNTSNTCKYYHYPGITGPLVPPNINNIYSNDVQKFNAYLQTIGKTTALPTALPTASPTAPPTAPPTASPKVIPIKPPTATIPIDVKIQKYCIEEMKTTDKTNTLITNLKALQTGLKTGLQTLPTLLLKGGNIHTEKQTKSKQYKKTKKQTKNKQYKQYKQYKTKINNINTSGRPVQLTYKKLSTIKNITRKANNKNAFS